MKHAPLTVATSALAVLLLLATPRPAAAKPTYGANCANCHWAATGKMNVVCSTAIDLGSKRKDGQRPGSLKTFTVYRGKTVSIPLDVLNGSSHYAVEFSNTAGGGLLNSRTNKLQFTMASGWYGMGNPYYYVNTKTYINWTGAKKRYTLNIPIKASCPRDYYELRLTVTGKNSSGRWTQTQRFYVNVK